MNKVFLIGNLTRDPEMRVTPSGASVCSFSLAVNRRGSQQGQREADFYHINAWRERGENCYKYLKKGNKCAVVGNLILRTYDGNDGQKRTVLDVTADEVEFLTPQQQGGQQGGQAGYAGGNHNGAASGGYAGDYGNTGGYQDTGDDLPF